jgi:PAS domain S-box-containing protein
VYSPAVHEERPSQRHVPDAERRAAPPLVLDTPAVHDLLRQAVAEAIALLDADGGLVYLLDADRTALNLLEDAGVTAEPGGVATRGIRIPLGAGMFGLAVAERRVVSTGDYAADRSFRHTPTTDRVVAEGGMVSMVVAPLLAGTVILGAMGVFSRRANAWSDASIALVRSLAAHAASTLANQGLIDELERSREQLERRASLERRLHDLVGSLASIRDPDVLLRRVMDTAATLSGARGALIDRVDDDGHLHVAYSVIDGHPDEDAAAQVPHDGWGVMGRAMQERRVIVTGDYGADDSFVHAPPSDALASRLGIRSVVAAPMIAYGEIVGVLAAHSDRIDAFGAEAVQLMSTLANHAAVAIANARRMEELDRSRQQLARRASTEQALREIGARLTTIRNPDEVLQQAVSAACRLVGGEWAEIARIEPDGALVVSHVDGLDDPELRVMQRSVHLRVGEGMLGKAALERRTLVTGDYLVDDSFEHRPRADGFARHVGFRSLIAAPLHAGEDEVIGVLAVHSRKPAAFDAEHATLVDAFADIAAVAMGNARLIEALDRSESRYRGLLAASPDIVFVVDEDGRFTYLSDTLERQLLWRADEMTGQHFSALIDVGSMGVAQDRWRALRETPGAILNARFDLIHRDGHRIPYEIRSAGIEIDGRFVGVQGAARDISERQRLERELRASEERYRELVAASPDLIWEVDADGRFTFVSATIGDLVGQPPEAVLGRNFREVLDPSTFDHALGAWDVVVREPGVVHGSRFALRHRDGHAVPIENYSIGRVAEDGTFAGAYGSARDLREREGLERELRESDARYRYLVENSPDIVWAADENGFITFLSETSEAVLGWRPEEAVGGHFSLVVHPSSVDDVLAQYTASLSLDGPRELRYRFAGLHRDGSRVPLEMHARTIYEDGVYRGSHGAVRDLRERERLERDLQRHAAELASSEERAHLARELHDSVTQALFSMTLVTKSIEMLLDVDSATARARLATLAELQKDALAEMRALIFELRPASLETAGLVQALRTHVAALQGRTGLSVALDAEDEGRLPANVEAALFRIAQEALNNVVKHAGARAVRVSIGRDAGSVWLAVDDDGAGFDPDHIPEGHLGLAGMRARAEQLGGRIEVGTGRGRGTRIRAEVPLPMDEAAGEDGAGGARDGRPGGAGAGRVEGPAVGSAAAPVVPAATGEARTGG